MGVNASWRCCSGAFERVVKGGAPELVLVSGYSGIGGSIDTRNLQHSNVKRSLGFAYL